MSGVGCRVEGVDLEGVGVHAEDEVVERQPPVGLLPVKALAFGVQAGLGSRAGRSGRVGIKILRFLEFEL